ncbi:Glycosyl transferase family 2 [Sphingobium yanoikuyae]|uniref:Chitooligosaccharide deacetylase n=2 Tax=Sphingobium yanoikuyae TaxID=13690 RepID=A0A084EBF0_SPHYA|nr:Glycosyl transferase family 2 [Sphingobium yanoikuyae]
MTAISVIMPAHNAARTIERALQSLRVQTFEDWEVIVVDDGSSDQTTTIVDRWVASDHRVRLIRQVQTGAGSARNSGLDVALGEWIVFLDSDDILASDHLATMIAAAAQQPEADLFYCGWQRVTGDGPWRDVHPAAPLPDAMLATARACPFAIHAAFTRRKRIIEAGRFDSALRIAEDWDLWQRLARVGVNFVAVPHLIARVHVERGSLSSDSERHLLDGTKVIRRGHDGDVRLRQDVPHAAGAPTDDLAQAIWWFALWVAAAAIGRGDDPVALLAHVDIPPPSHLDSYALAHIIEDGLAIGAGPDAGPLHSRWAEFGVAVNALCAELAARSDAPDLGDRTSRCLEEYVARSVPVAEEARIGSIAVIVIDPAKPIEDRTLTGCDRLWMTLMIDGVVLQRSQHLCFGTLSVGRQWALLREQDSPALRRALLMLRLRAGPFALGLPAARSIKQFARLLRSSRKPYRHRHATLPHEDVVELLYPRMVQAANVDTDLATIIAMEQDMLQGKRGNGNEEEDAGAPWVEPDYTQEDYWEQIFAKVDPWSYRNSYETLKYDQTIELIGDQPIDHALEIACAEGEFTRRLAARTGHILATDIAPTAVARAAEACADLANCSFQRLDLLTEDPPGCYDLIVASEVLYYLDPDALSAFADKVARYLKPGGIFLTAHGNLLIDEPDRTGFGWPHHFGAKGIGDLFASHGDFAREVELWTPLYRIMRFRKALGETRAAPRLVIADAAPDLPERVSSQVRWRGGGEAQVADDWHDLSVLMYHRIAHDGPASLQQWRTTPEQFEAQLAYLRAEGWQGVSMARMRQALHDGVALPERSIMLTFDDATRDFLDHALPLLHRYGFPATLFVPTGYVGGAAEWDKTHGAPAPLLDWDRLRGLVHCDVTIGAHGITHRSLTALDAPSVARELAGARFRLELELGRPVDTLAYPYGAFDGAIRNAARDCGYHFGFTCHDGRVARGADPLALFRREVTGEMDLERFAELVAGR